MARLSFVAFLALAFFSGAASAAPQSGGVHAESDRAFTGCGGTGGIISVTDYPNNPGPGEQWSITVVASTPQIIEDGSTINARYDGSTDQTTFNLCDLTSCPVQKGQYSFSYTVVFPMEYDPKHGVSLQTKGYTPSSEELFCFDFFAIEPSEQ
ncbi:hypothetical protein BJ322DRAFT_1110193 [Thelephora terrestris]|uniref:Phosphatidylglycerol/phosphatidylinositol transfer protein n=1 Tax=Thelephora terrestris TaxID=56493 RepID=A0A9P6HE36_9AGAM|nr:hypothetical protein BJ322DRAFT_1110193 [Thelephora terrestris]